MKKICIFLKKLKGLFCPLVFTTVLFAVSLCTFHQYEKTLPKPTAHTRIENKSASASHKLVRETLAEEYVDKRISYYIDHPLLNWWQWLLLVLAATFVLFTSSLLISVYYEIARQFRNIFLSDEL